MGNQVSTVGWDLLISKTLVELIFNSCGKFRWIRRAQLAKSTHLTSPLVLLEPHIVKFIKVRRLEWAGHVLRASDQRTMKIFKAMPEGTRKVGRPLLRWEVCVPQDILPLGIWNWRCITVYSDHISATSDVHTRYSWVTYYVFWISIPNRYTWLP